jgi:cytidyltransferase-like protein
MMYGLVIGKFMPVHKGHLALINFAAERCDRLIVSMSYTSADTIPGELHFHWLTRLLASRPSIEVHKIRNVVKLSSADLLSFGEERGEAKKGGLT